MAEEDVITAQLAVMCPNVDVEIIGNIVRRLAGVAAGSNDILFNLCLDQILFLPNNNDDPPAAPAEENEPAENPEPKVKKSKLGAPGRTSQSYPQLPGTSSSIDRIGECIKTVVSNDPGTSTVVSGMVPLDPPIRAAVSEPVIREDPELPPIDPEKKVDQTELDRYVNHVKEMFPLVEKQWLCQQFLQGNFMSFIVEQIVSRPGDVPKEKKREKKASPKESSPLKREKNYFAEIFADRPDEAYINKARVLLLQEFRQISSRSLALVFARFNFHYAPTVRAVRNALKNVNLRSLRGSSVTLNVPKYSDLGGTPMILSINVSKRPRRFLEPALIPDNLKLEIEWMNEHMDDEETSLDHFISASSTNVDSSADEKQTDERQKLLDDARWRGELYECAICCDEFLICEMVPCTDGHLFCPECLRNHAREIVYGQAKAAVTCLEADCKAGFTRDTLTKALDSEWISKLDERRLEEDVNCADIPGLIRCKYCNYAVVMEASVEENKVFKCGNPECEREVCRLCGVDWEEHVGLRCEELENADETKLRKEAEEKMAEAVIRRCHKCKAQLIKSDGCNKMTCRCGAKMCYICRKPDIDYNHFCQHVRNPGKSCEKCKSCYLWEDPNKIDKNRVDEIKKDAEKAQEALGTGQKRKIGVDDNPTQPPAPVVPPPPAPVLPPPPAPVQLNVQNAGLNLLPMHRRQNNNVPFPVPPPFNFQPPPGVNFNFLLPQPPAVPQPPPPPQF